MKPRIQHQNRAPGWALTWALTWALAFLASTNQPVFAQSCAPPPAGLISWWQAESNAFDSVGPNHGTLVNGADFATGEAGQAFNLNGASQYISVPDSPSLRPRNLTVEAWVSFPGASDYRTIIGKTLGDGPLDSFTIFYKYDLGQLHAVTSSSGGFGPGLVYNWIPAPGSLHHIALTFDDDADTQAMYVDGVVVATSAVTDSIDYDTHPVLIGGDIENGSLSSLWAGLIDEVSIYNRALGANEIQDIFNAGSAGKCPVPPVIVVQPADQTIPANAQVRFNVSVAGKPPFSYQWSFNSTTDLPGQTNSSLTITNVQPSDAGNYSVTVTNAGGSTISSTAVLTVGPAVFCAAPPAGLVSWWQAESNAIDAVGANNGVLVNGAAFAPGEVHQAFNFNGANQYVSVADSASVRPRNLTLEGWCNFSTTSGQQVLAGKSVGNGIFDSYAIWFLNGQLNGAIATNGGWGPVLIYNWTPAVGTWHHVAFTFDDDANTEALYLDGAVVVTNTVNGSVAYDSHPLLIGADGENGAITFYFQGQIDELSLFNRSLAPAEIAAIFQGDRLGKCTGPIAPFITGQPQDKTVSAGTNAIFTVLASGSSPISYQWQFHGTNLFGATNNPIVLTNVQIAVAGSYQVIITNAYGAVTSAAAALILQSPPVIDIQPQAVAVVPGSTAQFLVAVSGSPPFHFGWQRNATNAVGGNSYALTVSNVQVADAGSYTVVITNSFGSVTSVPAALVLNLAPSITNQPVSQSVPAGASLSFSVAAAGSAPLKYQWRLGGLNLAGATNALITLNNVQATNAGAYSVVISNSFGGLASSNALLVVTNPVCTPMPAGLIAWWQAENDTTDAVGTNNGVLINGASFGTGMVRQAFKFNGVNQYVSVADSPSLRPTNLTVEGWCALNGGSGIRTLVGKTFANGSLDSFSVLYNNGQLIALICTNGAFAPALSYTWAPVAGTLHHFAFTFDNVAFTQALYVDGELVAASTVNGPIAYDTHPVIIGADIENGNVALFWNGLIDEVSLYNRALSATEIRSLYNATSQGKCPSALSWVNQPVSQSAVLGSNATFMASVAGGRPVAYQWKLNGATLSAATNPALNLVAANYFQAGAYTLTASNGSGAITSSNAILTLLLPSLIPNGSFETGTAAGWVLNDLADPLSPLAVRGAGYYPGFGFFSSAPSAGNFCLTFGFDGGGPGRIRAALDVVLPPSPVTLTFTYRAAWDMQSYSGSTKARTFGVAIEPYGGGTAMQTNIILTAMPGTANYDTGNVGVSMDLSAFSGRAIRISFDASIPEYFTGPGFFQFDNIVLSYLPVPPFTIARAGANVILSWPVVFSNFTAQVGTSLPPTVAWSLLPTNSIVRGPTNASITLPVGPGKQLYRLRSL